MSDQEEEIMAVEPEIQITTVRQSDDVHHVFLGTNKDKGHVTSRGIDCPCEPEINLVRVGDDTIRIFIHDYRVMPCR